MNCITNNVAAAKTAVVQICIGGVIVVTSLVLKSILITLVGIVILVLGVRGIVKICKDK